MRAYTATIRVLLDPRVIGPDSSTEWKGDDAAYDYLSEVLTFQQSATVLDWAYADHDGDGGPAWTEITVDPDAYTEGDFLIGGIRDNSVGAQWESGPLVTGPPKFLPPEDELPGPNV